MILLALSTMSRRQFQCQLQFLNRVSGLLLIPPTPQLRKLNYLHHLAILAQERQNCQRLQSDMHLAGPVETSRSYFSLSTASERSVRFLLARHLAAATVTLHAAPPSQDIYEFNGHLTLYDEHRTSALALSLPHTHRILSLSLSL